MEIAAGRVFERAQLDAIKRRASLSVAADRAALLAYPEVLALPLATLQGRRVWTCREHGRIVGFVAVSEAARGIEIAGLFVDPPRQRSGAGTLLMRHAIALAERRRLRRVVVTAGLPATSFYRRLGFTDLETTQTRFGPAVRMALSL